MNLYVSNQQRLTSYNQAFKSVAVKKAVIPAAAAAASAAAIVANNSMTGIFYYPYMPEKSHSDKSALESAAPLIVADNSKTGIFGYPYIPEMHHSNKSAKESADAFLDNDHRYGKFVRKEVTRKFGRITKIVKYFENPDYTSTKTFDYTDKKSVKITTVLSKYRDDYISVDMYNEGKRTESYYKFGENGKYGARTLYQYDSEGRVSKELKYGSGLLSVCEYTYDSKGRVVGRTTTCSDIPENERSEYSYPKKYNEKIIYREEFIYDKNDNPIRVSNITEIEDYRGKTTLVDEKPEDYDMYEYINPNRYVNLTKNALSD